MAEEAHQDEDQAGGHQHEGEDDPQNAEEAAYGAAALALHAVGKVPWAEIKGLIRYDESEICL